MDFGSKSFIWIQVSYVLQLFSPNIWLVFSLSSQCLSKAEVFMFDEVKFTNIFIGVFWGLYLRKVLLLKVFFPFSSLRKMFEHAKMLQKSDSTEYTCITFIYLQLFLTFYFICPSFSLSPLLPSLLSLFLSLSVSSYPLFLNLLKVTYIHHVSLPLNTSVYDSIGKSPTS